MKTYIFLIFSIFAVMSYLKAQNRMESTYELRYNPAINMYEAHLHVGGALSSNGWNNFVGPSGFCIVLPEAAPNSVISCTSINPSNAGWNDNSPYFNTLTFDGQKDYHKFATTGAPFNEPLVLGSDILLFTFSLPSNICPASVRLFENNDPSPSRTPDYNPPGLTYDNSFQTLSGETYLQNITGSIYVPTITPVINQNGNTLFSSVPSGNQWYDDNGPVAGATSSSYTPITSGNYYVVAYDNFGCASEASNVISILITSVSDESIAPNIEIKPNPVKGELVLSKNNNLPVDFSIYNNCGKIVYSGVVKQQTIVDTRNFASGLYIIRLGEGKSSVSRSFIKQ